ncbi:MAG: hypothetical protein ACTS2F_00920 [Thainema sp.]
MKRSTILLGTAIAAGLGVAIPVMAQTQINSGRLASQEISGEIIGISDDEFLLQTNSGQVLVEAEDRPLRRANLAEGESITVTGIYDEGDFEAYTITRPNGDVIQVWD